MRNELEEKIQRKLDDMKVRRCGNGKYQIYCDSNGGHFKEMTKEKARKEYVENLEGKLKYRKNKILELLNWILSKHKNFTNEELIEFSWSQKQEIVDVIIKKDCDK